MADDRRHTIIVDDLRVLVDTGAHPKTVLQNASDLKVDLSDVQEVVLTHNHEDHVSGLLTLRREMMKRAPPLNERYEANAAA